MESKLAPQAEESYTRKAIVFCGIYKFRKKAALSTVDKEQETADKDEILSDIEFDENGIFNNLAILNEKIEDEAGGNKPHVILYYPNCDGTMRSIVDSASRAHISAPVPQMDIEPSWGSLRPVDLARYFNFGFDEKMWKAYINKQIMMRYENNLIKRHLSQKKKYMEGNNEMMPPQYMNPAPYFQPPPPGFPVGPYPGQMMPPPPPNFENYQKQDYDQ